MRISLIIVFVASLLSCNSSSKKDPNKAMDDTARMDNPPKTTVPVSIAPVKIAAADIPATLKFNGKVKQAWQWTDKLGDNILITSVVAPHDVKDEDGNEAQTAEVYAYHYVKKDGDYTLLWKITDAVKECSLDMFCDFINGSDNVTDLNNNGIAETKVQYATSCHGDVSPSYMKLIMNEGKIQYSLRGNRWIKDSEEAKFEVTADNVNLETLPGYNKEEDEWGEKTFGRYESEKEFAAAPPEFLTYARSEWLKYSKEKMGE